MPGRFYLMGKFECIGQWRSAWCTRAELSEPADSETPRRLPHADYVLHRTGCSQASDQLLRKGSEWPDLRRRVCSRNTPRSESVDENTAAAVDGGDGSDGLQRMDLRSLATPCGGVEGSPPADAASDCGREEEEMIASMPAR